FNTGLNQSIASFNPYMLADALLSRPKLYLSDDCTILSTKQFTLEALSVRLRTKPVGWKNNFIKKGREGKKFSWVGEKILSCKLWFQHCLVRLARVYFLVC
ncbi:MAG: hypothetical protein LC111_05595, partial [Bacteroidia bacterium]|nr:hypothetical protein [Bacteroidia bacterium]